MDSARAQLAPRTIDRSERYPLKSCMTASCGRTSKGFRHGNRAAPASLCQPPAAADALRCSAPRETTMDPTPGRITRIASYLIAFAALLLVLKLHLLPALLAGLLVYALVDSLAPTVQRLIPGTHAHWLIVALLSAVVVSLLTLAIIGAIGFLQSERGNPSLVFENMMPLIERARGQLPQVVVDYLPASIDDFRAVAIEWLREHAAQLQVAGKTAARVIVH